MRKNDVRVGELTETSIPEFAYRLAPIYQTLRWHWSITGRNRTPDCIAIQRMILFLINTHTQDYGGSGGLYIGIEQGKKILYVDHKIGKLL